MFRGRFSPCYEKPARMEQVLAELERRPMGEMRAPPAIPDGLLERVHSSRYLEFLRGAWSEWVAEDPANADLDALPSVWPVRGFRNDIDTANFTARLGL